VILDFEMSESQIESWLRDQNICNTDSVHLVSLRGAASSFDILNPVRRREWAARLRTIGAQLAVLDCLRPAMDALSLDEHREAGRWLTAFDEMLKEANIPEALVVHHSGHTGERSRGDSRILDWPDGIWSLVRENRDDLNSTRFISAKGRDISVDEGELTFNPQTRHLGYAPKTRKAAGADRVMVDVLREVASAAHPMSARDVIAVSLHNDYRHAVGRAERAASVLRHPSTRRVADDSHSRSAAYVCIAAAGAGRPPEDRDGDAWALADQPDDGHLLARPSGAAARSGPSDGLPPGPEELGCS
jgi:hypothetical protein